MPKRKSFPDRRQAPHQPKGQGDDDRRIGQGRDRQYQPQAGAVVQGPPPVDVGGVGQVHVVADEEEEGLDLQPQVSFALLGDCL